MRDRLRQHLAHQCLLILHPQALALIDLSHGRHDPVFLHGCGRPAALALRLLGPDDLGHLAASLLEADDALVELLHLPLLPLRPRLLISDLPVQVGDLRPEARDHRSPLLDLTRDVQEPSVVLLHLSQLISFLDEFIEHLVLVLDLVLSEDHHIQALALIREVCAQLFDLQAVLLDASLDRVQLPLLLDQDLIGWVTVYV